LLNDLRDLMRIQSLRLLLTLLAVSLSFASLVTYAQFGEIAGQLHTNVSVGSSNSVTFTLVNDGSTPIRFEILTPPQFQSATPNTVVPVVTASPMNGTIAPSSEFSINITVYVPAAKNNTPGTRWTGIIQAVVVSNSSGLISSGANIQEGVAKIITITAQSPKPSILPYVVAAAIAVAVVAGGAYLYMKRHRKAPAARTARKQARAAARRRPGKVVRKKGTRKARRPATRRKPRAPRAGARRPRRRR
jgi:hypothetical protein